MAPDDNSTDGAAEASPPSDCNESERVLPAPPTVRPLNDVAAADVVADENRRSPLPILPRYNDFICAAYRYTSKHYENIKLNNHILKVQARYRAIDDYDLDGKYAFVTRIVRRVERREGGRFVHLDEETGLFSLASNTVKREAIMRRLQRKKPGKVKELPPIPADKMYSMPKGALSSLRSVRSAAKKKGRKSSKPQTTKENNTRKGQSKSKGKAPGSSGSKRRPAESSPSRRAKAPRTTPTPRRSSASTGGITSAKGKVSTRAESAASRRRGRSTSKRAEERSTSKRNAEEVSGILTPPPQGETMPSFCSPGSASSSSNSTTKNPKIDSFVRGRMNTPPLEEDAAAATVLDLFNTTKNSSENIVDDDEPASEPAAPTSVRMLHYIDACFIDADDDVTVEDINRSVARHYGLQSLNNEQRTMIEARLQDLVTGKAVQGDAVTWIEKFN